MTKTKHAQVTQEYRDLASCIEKECFRRFGDRGWATFDTSLAGQLIADYSAEVERKVLARVIKACDEEGYIHRSEVAEIRGTK